MNYYIINLKNYKKGKKTEKFKESRNNLKKILMLVHSLLKSTDHIIYLKLS